MDTFFSLVIIIVVLVCVIRFSIYIIRTRHFDKKSPKSEMDNIFKSIYDKHFPGGQKQIDEQTKEIIKLSNNKTNYDQAKDLLLKGKLKFSMGKNVFDYVKSLNFDLNEKEIKSIVGFITFDSYNETVDKLTNIGFGMNNNGYDEDEIPVGYGEFGLCITNPIPVKGIIANETYLNKIRTKDGKKIKWERIGSRESEVKLIEGVIDIYKIFTEDDDYLCEFYISPYNKKISNKAPKGFKIYGGADVNSIQDLNNKFNKARRYKKDTIEFNGNAYFDDRLFVLYLCKGKVQIQPDGIVATTIYHDKAPDDYVWCLVTYRNCNRYPSVRVDSFYKKEDAIKYMKKVEPETPLISLNGKCPQNPLSYEEYLSWKASNNLKEYNWRDMYLDSRLSTNQREVMMEMKEQFRGIK